MRILVLTYLSLIFMMCNTPFLKHKDYKFNLKHFIWNIKIRDQVGEIYFKGPDIIFGRNWDSTFLVISSINGDVLETLRPFTIEKERASLILESTAEFKVGYSLHNVPVDKEKYAKVTLKVIDRQYRGDNETFYLIVKTLSNKEFTILFNRRQFSFVEDITYFKDGKFVIKHNCEAGATTSDPFITYIGLLDLEKIIKE